METNTIHAGIVISARHDTKIIQEELRARGIVLSVYHDAHSIDSSLFHDVILVHESFLPSFRRDAFAHSILILLSDDVSRITDLYLRAQQLEVFTIVPMPLVAAQLYEIIKKAYDRLISSKMTKAAEADGGRVVAVASFSNGSGKSILAYNLARKLASFLPRQSVSLVDMNSPFGIGKAMLGIDSEYSWHTIRAVLDEGVVPAGKLLNIAHPVKAGFLYLAGPTHFSDNTPLSATQYRNLIRSLRGAFRISILDMASITSHTDMEKLSYVDVVLNMIAASSSSIVQTAAGMRELSGRGSGARGLYRHIINRVDESQGRAADLIASRMNIEVFGIIDDDPETIRATVENGEFIDDRTLLLDRQIYSIAEKLMKELF